MDSDGSLSFRIECPDCDVVKQAAEFTEADKFAQKHQQHTGHEMDWVQVDFGDHLIMDTKYEVSCEVCEKVWNFDSQQEAHEHREDHSVYTDHGISEEPEEVIVEKYDFEDSRQPVKQLISDLCEEYEEGAPAIAVIAIMTQADNSVNEVRSKIKKLRTQGEVYEPKRGRLRVT